MGTPKTDPDYEHSDAALRDEDADAMIACLGDDAAKLREDRFVVGKVRACVLL